MYYVVLGIFDKDNICLLDGDATNVFSNEEEALDCFHKMNREFVYNFLERDIGFYESDRGFCKEILDQHGMYRRSIRYIFD